MRREKKEEEEAGVHGREERAMESSLVTGIRGLLECPGCGVFLSPPHQIFQCSNGHLICSLCSTTNDCSFPSCESKVVGRNPMMEGVAKTVFTWENRGEKAPKMEPEDL